MGLQGRRRMVALALGCRTQEPARVQYGVSTANIVPPPSSLVLTPATGVAGNVIVLTGVNLRSVSSVRFGAGITGVEASFVMTDDSTVNVTVPVSSGTVDVEVTTDGGSATLVDGFVYSALGPTVTGVAPGRVSIIGGTLLTVTGTAFTGATLVTINGVACTALTVVDSTTITCRAPALAAGTYTLAVTTPGGTGSLPSSIVVTDPAAVALGVYQRGQDFTGTAWPGIASAGTSGPASPAFSMFGTPTTTTAPSGRQAGRCGAGLGAAAGFKFGTLADFFNTGSGTLVLAHRVQGASTNLGSNADGAVFADVSGFARITASSAALAIRSELDSGGVAVTSTPLGWHTYAIRWNQSLSKYEVRINRGAWTSVTKTSALSLAGVLYMGVNPINGNFLDWSVATILAAKTALSDATISDLEQYAADYAGLDL
jgi:hypothetical protein